jgi:hypothetical protein
MISQKKQYAKPELSVHGNVEVLTKGSATGSRLDADFKAGTPVSDLTFS